MNKELKQEYEEIIDNNGNLIKKHIYTEAKNGCLSSILKYDKNNIYLEGEYFTEKDFSDLFYTKKREYNSDNSFIEKIVYTKQNNAGWFSGVEYYNSNEKYIKGDYYFDCEFSNLRFSQYREYNDDNSYFDKFTFTKPDLAGCFSISQKFDVKNRLIEQNRYLDNNFVQLYEHIHREYNDDDSYSAEFIYTQPDIEGCLSISQKFDANNRLIEQNRYIDNDFKQLYKHIVREYNNDNSYVAKFIFTQENENSWLSAIEHYDANEKYLKGNYYSDKEYKDLCYSKYREYDKDNNFIDKSIFAKPEIEGSLSISQKFDTNNNLIEQSRYIDNKFKQIHKHIHREYNNNDNYVIKLIYTKKNKSGLLSKIEHYDSNKKYVKSEFYFDKKCKKLYYSKYREYDNDGSYVDKSIFIKPDIEGCLSVSQKFDVNNRLIEQNRYLDSNFEQLHEHINRDYNDDNSYACKFVYTKLNKAGWLSGIEYYSSNNKYIKGDYYTDKECNDLYYSVHREYNTDGTYIKKIIYEKPDNDGFLSILSKYNKNGRIIETFYYIDNNFTKLGLHTTIWNFFFVHVFKKLGIIKLINKIQNRNK